MFFLGGGEVAGKEGSDVTSMEVLRLNIEYYRWSDGKTLKRTKFLRNRESSRGRMKLLSCKKTG
jgi:hypothetical protein